MNLPFFFGGKRGELAPNVSPFLSLQREIDRVFSDFSRGFPAAGPGVDLVPRMDITEKNGTVTITAELPGLEEKDVEVTVVDNVLTLKGEKKAEREEKGENRYLIERSYGSFQRSLELPEGVKPEDIKASMTKGVLTVTLPKPRAAKPDAKKIKVLPAS